VLKKFQKIVLLLFLGAFQTVAFAWDTPPQVYNMNNRYTQGGSEGTNFGGRIQTLTYIDDGSSQVRYSLTQPTEGSTSGEVFKFATWLKLDVVNGNNIVFRAENYEPGDNKTVLWGTRVAGKYDREDKDGYMSGVFYIWYGKQAMATINWTLMYYPFPAIAIPSGVIDLGICHKSVSGRVLTKPVNSTIAIHGWSNGVPYSATRTLTFSNLPDGVSFTEGDGMQITSGITKMLSSPTTSIPITISDTFNARLDCDQAKVGVQTWRANVTYTVD